VLLGIKSDRIFVQLRIEGRQLWAHGASLKKRGIPRANARDGN
jgi:hypothetical protein